MTSFTQKITDFIERYVIEQPKLTIIILIIAMSILGYKARDFTIDASSETLLLENDKDLQTWREVNKRYGVNDFLIIAYTPENGDLFSDDTLDSISRLRNELSSLEKVTSAFTILDVPLLESPPMSYSEIKEGVRKLESPETDRELARIEFKESPFYRNLIVSPDLKTTALILNLEIDETYRRLQEKRRELVEKKHNDTLTPAESKELDALVERIRSRLDRLNKEQHENITAVRAIMDKYRDDAELFLGGVSMIADDMITFIKNDLKVFGLGVFFLLLIMLGIIFRKIRWVVLPMLCCGISVVAMMGILGTFGWDVTVISSNFVSLQLIITLAIIIHLMVRYREYLINYPEASQKELVVMTIRSKFTPCLYAVMTTIAGFSSLLLCDILPVINFGWMMSAGITVSLILTFILFPACVVLLKKEQIPKQSDNPKFSVVHLAARFTEKNGALVLTATAVLFVFSVIGVSRLAVENSFIDYFKESTEIHQGMLIIDRKLGGTTPLDVIVKFEDMDELLGEEYAMTEEEEAFLDPFGEESEEPEDKGKYWFTPDRMEIVEKVHDYLEKQPETGKVLSLATLLKIGRKLNDGESLDSLELSILHAKLPEKFKSMILDPYLSIENDEVRFMIRIKDSLEDLKRNVFLERIRRDLESRLNLKPEQFELTGTMVLYNNMLQSLFRSQILTLGFVALALTAMFLILFRSFSVALIGLFPNLFASGAVLGVMGWMNIPLDMMTITIAAISVGIAVDDTIHYIYRFKDEIRKDGSYINSLHRCHGSIGHAMYYTSITVIIGFSILMLSNFYPTIYFGLFTGLAMLLALTAALTLLPRLLILFKPFGPDAQDAK